ncbi:MAG: dockerin type I repeat-containing protein [Ruminococcus sp.]|nr:dockerin type I repeat-containing protein [Ruminococcus sp.]
MKKTIHTLLTAALFAASNASAMPTMAAEGYGNNTRQDSGKSLIETLQDKLEMAASSIPQDVYGPAPVYDVETTTFSDPAVAMTATTTVPLYGVMPTMLTQTTTMLPQPAYGVIPTTLTQTTAMPTQPAYGAMPTTIVTATETTMATLYGPPITFKDYGDINSDGVIDAYDLIKLRRTVITQQYDSYFDQLRCDLNKNNKVDIGDVVKLTRYLLGMTGSPLEGDDSSIKTTSTTTTADLSVPTTTTSSDKILWKTETTTYDPRKDLIVPVYGTMNTNRYAKDISGTKTTATTAEPNTTEEK